MLGLCAWMAAPGTRIGPATDDERKTVVSASVLGRVYDTPFDRESAHEILLRRASETPPETSADAKEDEGWTGAINDFLFGSTGPRGGRRDGVVQSVLKSSARSLGNQLVRGMLGSLLKTKRR